VLQEGKGFVLRSGQHVLCAAAHVLRAGRDLLRPGLVRFAVERPGARAGPCGQAV
jgi:hypothetical protein